MAEDEIMRKHEEEQKKAADIRDAKQREKRERVMKKQQEAEQTQNTASGMAPKQGQAPANKLSKIEQKKQDYERQQEEVNRDIERLQMQQEDEYSMKVEVFQHRQRFVQKDEFPPELPAAFTETGVDGAPAGPLAYHELCPTPRPQEPTKDNY